MPSDSPTYVLQEDSGVPSLSDPPIEEVVCGVVFPAIAALDALEQGIYWNSVSDRFPHKQLQPALIDGGPGMFVGTLAPSRAWLISADDERLIQVQHDRFYMNWRKRKGQYPRFRDHGDDEGLCSLALSEFETFKGFVQQRLGIAPQPARIELQKQDVLLRGKHWTDLRDLSSILPVVRTFADVQTTQRAGFNLRMVEPDDLGRTTLQIATRVDHEHTPNAVQLDFQCSVPCEGKDLRDTFHAANERVDRVFKSLFTDEAWRRFGGQK